MCGDTREPERLHRQARKVGGGREKGVKKRGGEIKGLTGGLHR